MKTAAILNSGNSAWAFQNLAESLTNVLWLDISETPADYNYVLSWDGEPLDRQTSFIPVSGMKLASDKRLLARVFKQHQISIPDTYLIAHYEEVVKFISEEQGEWCLKYPISCGGSGHRKLDQVGDIPRKWLQPYVIQRFIKQAHPAVYRLYCAEEELFGWNVRQFPSDKFTSPWVAHAQGAIYQALEKVPDEVATLATKALRATNLWSSFGCVDLIRDGDDNWLVLEVGTDGIFNHVDRQIGDFSLEQELARRVAEAFWSDFSSKPWRDGAWSLRNS